MTPPGRPYHQVLRGERHRWWRSLLSSAVVVAGLAVLVIAFAVSLLVADLGGLVDAGALEDDAGEPWVLFTTNVTLGALVPISLLAVWLGHGWRPRFVSSVAGGLRWGWMLRCAAVSFVLAAAGTVVFWVLDGPPTGAGDDVVLLLAIVVLTTPLQAAGEEYFFRGWMSQAVGALFARAAVGAVVAATVSATLFAVAHGSQNAFLFADRFAFGLLASYLAWRTGGLEAGIAAHTVNNVVVFVPVILTGGLEGALGVSEAGGAVVLVDVVAMLVLGTALTWLARRSGVQRTTAPDAGPAPALLVPPHGTGSIAPR